MSRLLAHRYELLDVLGEGGAAVVYRALDHVTGVQRALKLLDTRRDRSATLARLRREAGALARLHHPHILAIHDVQLGDPAFVVTTLCEEPTLEQRLAASGRLPIATSMAIGRALLSALGHAHRRGVVHRDVKPANVLFLQADLPVLADFGIALVTADRSRDTLEGETMGTFAYMAPEQRLDARSADERSDLYALGATLYHCMAGKVPTDLFMAEATSPRWWGVPPPIAEVLRRATRYRREQRYEDATSMALALREAFDRHQRAPLTRSPIQTGY